MRVLVIGAGHMGRLHATTVAQDPAVDTVCIRDPSAEKVRSLCRKLDVLPEQSGTFDAVIIASPPASHAQLLREFLGHWVLVEKPVVMEASEAHGLGSRVVPAHSERFNPAVQAAASIRVDGFSALRQGPHPERVRDDVVRDLMVHDLQLAEHFIGGPLSLMNARGTVNHAIAELQGPDGRHIRLQAARGDLSPERKIWLSGPDEYELDLINKTLNGSICTSPEDALTQQWHAFKQVINGSPPVVSWQQGLAAASLAAEIAGVLCDS